MRPHGNHYDYLAFELLVGALTHDGYAVTVVHSPAGEGDAICRMDPANDLSAALDALETRDVDQAFLIDLGSFLFGELFAGDVGDLYRTSLGLARNQGKGLRLRLRFTPPELAALPWEFLYDAREGSFLAAAPETALVRYVPMRLPARPTAVQGPLRVLAVVASPNDLAPLDVERERAIVREALAERMAAGQIQLQILEHATVAAINDAMRNFRPHIFHFVGHSYVEQGRGFVLLESDDGHAYAVDETAFQAFFGGAQEARLAVLNACQSAVVSRDQTLLGLAPRLLQRQLGAVVGMQFPIPDGTALVFAREFYRCVALGYPVDTAVSEARKGILQEVGPDAQDWGIPVLYLRAQDGRLFQVEQPTASLPLPAPPPEPVRPPEVAGFVGRNEELAYFAGKLEEVKLAVITGMAGVGKTALAAALARRHRQPSHVFWHSFHEGEGVEAITWKLAAFLAHNGQDDLWRLLEGARQTGGQPPPAETIFDYLLQMVRGRGYLLCFDDFHYVDDDPLLNRLVERLREALTVGEISIIVTGRRMPEFVRLAEFPPLAGLSLDDVRRLLRMHEIEIGDELQERLHRYTGGNAEFLVLAIDTLRQAREPAELIARLAETDDIARYLMREVDNGLNGSERAVMGAVAIFLNYPASRDAIEFVLDAGSVLRILRNLADRHLLAEQQGPAGREYGQHAVVQSFYYQATGQRQRRQMHRRAGDYYASEEPDLLRSALHYERSAEYALAARQATAEVWTVINQGNARPLASLLIRLAARPLEAELSVHVSIARGMTLGFLGERAAAAAGYAEALAQLAALGPSATDRGLQARACRGMGELMEDESPQEALAWFRRGLAAVPVEDIAERPALLIKSGMVEIYTGNYTAARDALHAGLELLPLGPSALRAAALAQLASISLYEGNTAGAVAYTEEALTISEQVQDHFLKALILGNLGMFKHVAGDWPGGIARFEEALSWIERLGNEKQKAYVALNLGVAQLYRGDFVQAEQHLDASYALANRYEDRLTALKAQFHLAELHIRRQRWEEAAPLLRQVEATAGEVDDKGMLVWVYAAQAEIELAGGRGSTAEALALRAIELAEALDAAPDKAIGLRMLGRVLASRGELDRAREAFAASAAFLADNDPYESARTKVHWGLALAAGGDTTAGLSLLVEARAVLHKLGAAQELAQVGEILPD